MGATTKDKPRIDVAKSKDGATFHYHSEVQQLTIDNVRVKMAEVFHASPITSRREDGKPSIDTYVFNVFGKPTTIIIMEGYGYHVHATTKEFLRQGVPFNPEAESAREALSEVVLMLMRSAAFRNITDA